MKCQILFSREKKNLKCRLMKFYPACKVLKYYLNQAFKYGKCPKISNTKVSDKMTYANSADPDQTAPEGGPVSSGSTLFATPLSILNNRYIKSKLQDRLVWNKVFEILGHLLYSANDNCSRGHSDFPTLQKISLTFQVNQQMIHM